MSIKIVVRRINFSVQDSLTPLLQKTYVILCKGIVWYTAHMGQSILLVEDDKGIQEFLSTYLLDNGYSVRVAGDGDVAISYAEEIKPDLVVLDLGLPTISGESVCKHLKKQYPDIPIIILTSRDGTVNVLKGFDLGADDYITKPFSADELLARIVARLKKVGNSTVLSVDDLTLDRSTLQVRRGEKEIQLTPKEFKLLEYLMLNHGKVLTREMILNRVWVYAPNVETRVVDVYMGYLKKKIDQGVEKPLIKSVRGFGYSLKE